MKPKNFAESNLTDLATHWIGKLNDHKQFENSYNKGTHGPINFLEVLDNLKVDGDFQENYNEKCLQRDSYINKSIQQKTEDIPHQNTQLNINTVTMKEVLSPDYSTNLGYAKDKLLKIIKPKGKLNFDKLWFSEKYGPKKQNFNYKGNYCKPFL